MYKREGKPEICLFTDPCDFRCGINTLSAKVSVAGKDPFSNTVFIFCNKRKDCLKMLYCGGAGFWLLQFRLEKGKFRWLKGKRNDGNQLQADGMAAGRDGHGAKTLQ